MRTKIIFILTIVLFSSCKESGYNTVKKGDTVVINYKIYNKDNIRLDESDIFHDVKCREPEHLFKFTVGRGEVIKGWDSLIIGCKKNKKYRFSIPNQKSYGNERIYHDIPPQSDLVLVFKIFEIW